MVTQTSLGDRKSLGIAEAEDPTSEGFENNEGFAAQRKTLARIFAAWRAPSAQLLEVSFAFGSTIRCGLFKHYIGLRRFSAALKWELASAKPRHLAETLATIDEGTAASETQHKLKGFMGSSNKLQQGLAPLPALRNTNNLPCSSTSELLSRWIHFFC